MVNPKERRELDNLPAKLAEAEARVAKVDERLNDPAVTGDSDLLEKACADLAEAQAGVDVLFARWQELEERAKG